MVSAPKSKAAGKGRSLPAAPLATAKVKKVVRHPLVEGKAKNFSIGQDVRPKTADLSRYVRWPLYIKLQRQRRVLYKRLKVPPALNLFNCTIDKNQASQLLRVLSKYSPETEVQKKQRLKSMAEKKEKGEQVKTKRPVMLKFGINHVTDLVEFKKAKLVVIAHDVDPVELVVWLPALCRQKDIPYCIIKGKSRLGKLVHQKTSCVVAVDNILQEDQAEFDNLCRNFRAQFNDNAELRKRWGGGVLGIKTLHRNQKREKAIALDHARKLGVVG
eukprot:Lankesteria_metandrocarpae@DN156_c0_g1_i1.p1